MAGIFGEAINSRSDFFVELSKAKSACAALRNAIPVAETLGAVWRQLEAIERWTANGRTPTRDERMSLDMSLRMFREYETTDNIDIYKLTGIVSAVHVYVRHWPDDATASDPSNREYLSTADPA